MVGLTLWRCQGRRVVRSALRSRGEHLRLVEEWMATRRWARFRSRKLNCVVSVTATSIDCEPYTPCEYVRRVLEPLRRSSPLCEGESGTVGDAFAKYGFRGVSSVDVIRDGARVDGEMRVGVEDRVALLTLHHHPSPIHA